MKTLAILCLCFVALVALALPAPYVPTPGQSVSLAWNASPSKASAGFINYELLSGPNTNSMSNWLLVGTNLYCTNYPLIPGSNAVTVVAVDTNAHTVSGYAPFIFTNTPAIPLPAAFIRSQTQAQ